MARSPTIRARQRSRTALRAFSNNLIPALIEVGIDRVQISVSGSWHTRSLAEYREMVIGGTDFADWFRRTVTKNSFTTLQTRSTPPCTLGSVRARLGHPNGIPTYLNFSLTANPTRTLAHLLAEHGGRDDFVSFIARLRPAQFFAMTDNFLPRGRGTLDNWVHNADLLFDCLGDDPFGQFLPIYVQQLKQFAAELFAPTLTARIEEVGENIRVIDDIATISLLWGGVRVPQIETYFERHHSQAIAAVHSFATRALANLNHATVRRFEVLASYFVERVDDGLLVGSNLTDLHRLAIYAKDKSRLRFEIRRNGKGSYPSIRHSTDPANHLLGIFELERQNLLSQCRWPHVGEMFDEPSRPSIADLSSLCSIIAEACQSEGVPPRPIFHILLEEGGVLRRGSEVMPERLVARLFAAGVLNRSSIRQRDINRPRHWLALREEHRVVIAAMYAVMSLGEDGA